MMQIPLAMALFGGAVAVSAAVDNRYQAIPRRNPFGLRSPLPVVTELAPKPTTPPPKVVVTGLTDLGGIRKALVEIFDSGKPPRRAILVEGEDLGSLHVLKIDLVASCLKVRVGENESTLNLQIPKPGPPVPPPPTVELIGVTSIFQKHKALLEITPGPGKPVVRPILMEGERLDSVEVVSINVEKSEVTIKNGPVVTNLNFKASKGARTPPPPVPWPVRG